MGKMRNSGLRKAELESRLRERHTARRGNGVTDQALIWLGVISLEDFYLAIMKLNLVITNKDIEILARIYAPDSDSSKQVNYANFLNQFI